jgi:hypothetical protein
LLIIQPGFARPAKTLLAGCVTVHRAILVVAVAAILSATDADFALAQDQFSIAQVLTQCQSNRTLCEIAVMRGLTNAGILGDACLPSDTTPAVIASPIITWLMEHPETANLPYLDGIEAAAKNIYPCRRI